QAWAEAESGGDKSERVELNGSASEGRAVLVLQHRLQVDGFVRLGQSPAGSVEIGCGAESVPVRGGGVSLLCRRGTSSLRVTRADGAEEVPITLEPEGTTYVELRL